MQKLFISNKVKRISCGAAALLFFAALTLSAVFLAAEAGHECEGEGCHVCARMQECEAALRRFGGVLPGVFAAAVGAFFLLLRFVELLINALRGRDAVREDVLAEALAEVPDEEKEV